MSPQLAQHLPPRLARYARLVVESSARRPLEIDLPKLALVDERRIGEALIRIYERDERAMTTSAIAICPGSYDPVTNGHLDIIGRASRVFDRVIVGVVGQAIRKSKTLFTRRGAPRVPRRGDRRTSTTSRSRSSPTCSSSSPRERGATAIVKGLRAISDFEYEFEMNQLNRKLAPEIESVYVFASPEYSFLSSTGVKEMATFGGDVSDLVPAAVAEALAASALPSAHADAGQELAESAPKPAS